MSITAAVEVVADATKTTIAASRSTAAGWRWAQDALLLAGVLLVGLLLLRPAVGLAVMWNVLIPVAPALLVVAPGVWRNLCPMATLSLLPRRFGFSRRRILPRRHAGLLELASVSALLLIVPFRHIALDTDGALTALMLLSAAALALAMGFGFEWRSGWCASLCPIHPVEKLYGFAPAITVENRRCSSCAHCTAPCPDSTRTMTPAVTGPTALERWLGHGLIGGFAGFIWGWYQVPDYPGSVAAAEIVAAYLRPCAGAAVSLALYAALRQWLCRSRAARHTLVKVFGAAAVSSYYAFRVPALIGFGAYPDTGLLYDLSPLLPSWTPALSQALTTPFFAWFLLFRRSPNASWMRRPQR